MTQKGSYRIHSAVEEESKAPDGGWGWAVVAGSMLVNFLLCGHGKAFGVYFQPFMINFAASTSRVAWVQSLYMTTFTLTAPLASVLSTILGSRMVGMVGGVTACLGMAASSLAPNLEVLYLTYGVMQGIATSFTFTPGVMTVGGYFAKRRGLANGLNIAGNALGGIIMPLVVNSLIENLGLRGGLLLMGAILLNACVGVSLWQPLEWHIPKPNKLLPETYPDEVNRSEKAIKSSISLQRTLSVDDVTASQLLSKRLLSLKYSDLPPKETNFSEENYKEVRSKPIESHLDRKREIQRWLRPVVVVKLRSPESDHWESLKPRRKVTRTSSMASSFLYVSTLHLNPSSTVVEETESVINGSSSSGSEVTGSPSSTTTPTVERKRRRINFDKKLMQDGKERLKKTVFKNGYFYLFAFTLFFHQLGYPGTHTYLPMRGLALGLSRQKSATLLSAVALADFIGRVTCGWLSDLQLCPRKYWFMGGMFLSAIFTFSIQFMQDYVSLLLCAGAFGLSSGCYIGLVLALFGDMFGSDNVGIAYSMAVLFSGSMGMAGPPLLGYVLEQTSSYSILHTIMGSAQLLGCSVWLFEPLARRHQDRVNNQETHV